MVVSTYNVHTLYLKKNLKYEKNIYNSIVI